MVRIIVSIIILINFQQDLNRKLIKKIDIKCNYTAIDQLANVYLLNNKVLYKYSKNGEYLFEYSNNFLGTITFIDVTDPLRILVFYEEYNEIIFLDNKLAEIGSPILLDDFDFGLIKLACVSEENGFWIYNYQLQQLLHINKELKLINQSNKLNVLIGNDLEPNFLLERNKRVYLNIPEMGILVFNNYGFYEKTIPIFNLEGFQILNNQIIYSRTDSLFRFNQQTIVTDTLFFNDTSILDIKLEQNISVIRKNNFVELYKLLD